jgi:hypothetical protein
MVETKVVGGNVWSKVVEKFLIGLGAGAIGLALTYSINFLQTGDFTELPTWFVASVPFLTAVLIAAQNAWVHREKVVPTE